MSERDYPKNEEAALGNVNYDPKDNSTYMSPPYDKDMVRDVECHMYANPESSIIHRYCGTVLRGEFHVESSKASAKKVFKYPTATELSLIKIQDVLLKTLVPESLMIRYDRNPNAVEHVHTTPIFYDKSSGRFVYVMDSRVLAEVSPEEINLKGLDNVHCYRLKGGGFALGVYAKSVNELTKDNAAKDGAFAQLSAAYARYFLSKAGGEKVIVVRQDSSSNHKVLKYNTYHQTVLGDMILNQEVSLEFFKAVRFEDDYYLLNGDEIDRASFFSLKYDEEAGTWKDIGPSYSTDKEYNIIVLKYTDADWEIINLIYSRLKSIGSDLTTLFNKTKLSGSKHSAPLENLSMNNLFLEDKRS